MIPVRRSSDGRALLVVSRNSVAFDILHGQTVAREWNSVLQSVQPAFGRNPVKARIGTRLAYPAASFDVIYLCHVLEHHRDDQLVPALRDMHRAMKPGGVLRISTPDVERDARLYLEALERALQNPSQENEAGYRLAVTRTIDQCVRSEGGGEMKRAVEDGGWHEEDLDASYGKALDYLIGRGESARGLSARPRRDIRDLPFALWRRAVTLVSKGHPATTGEYDMAKLDEFVLREALEVAGFTDVRVCAGHESRIPGWERWDFDRAADGTLVEPGLYLEASRG
jgi:SAM-dependent methyltransferase